MMINREHFGIMTDGRNADLFTLEISSGMKLQVTNYGGRVVSLYVPDKKGEPADIVLGYDSLEGYTEPNPFVGTLVGRCANRTANGRFSVDGTEYALSRNDRGKHHSHGGFHGFDKKLWDAKTVKQDGNDALELCLFSPDQEEGYPGNLNVTVTYSLTENNAMRIRYRAATDRTTPVSLTSHVYFNLSGHAFSDILGHSLMIDADRFAVINEEMITTGELRDVTDTPLDFRGPEVIGSRLDSRYEQMTCGKGYNHTYLLNSTGNGTKACELYHQESGRLMEVYTTMPGLHLYAGQNLDGTIHGKNSVVYNKYAGLCLETQHLPNAANHVHFPQPFLKRGEMYDNETIYKFSTVR